MGSRTVCYLAIRAVMSRAEHVAGVARKRKEANWVHLVSLLRQEFHSLSNKSMSSKKAPPSLAVANFTRLKPPYRAVPPSPFASPRALDGLRPGRSGDVHPVLRRGHHCASQAGNKQPRIHWPRRPLTP